MCDARSDSAPAQTGRWPRIINISTVSGKQPPAKSIPTSVTRAAGIALTKALSKEFAADNILVNTVCVGVFKSGQQERAAARQNLAPDQHYAKLGSGVPLGRVGEAREAANVIAFLASDAASYRDRRERECGRWYFWCGVRDNCS